MDGDSGFDSPAARPTPETDLHEFEVLDDCECGIYVVRSTLACKLERERDDARHAIRQWIEAWNRYGDGASLTHPRLTRAMTAARKLISENAKLSHEEGGKEQL